MKTFAEQIARLDATLDAKRERLSAIMQRAMDEDRSTDAEESAEFDRTDREVKTLEADRVRLESLERLQAKAAKPAADQAKAVEDSRATGVLNALQIRKAVPKLAPGIAFARYARCKGISFKEHRPPELIAQHLYPDHEHLQTILKIAVPAANTIDATLAANLVATESGPFADFVEFLRPQTILGKFGQVGCQP